MKILFLSLFLTCTACIIANSQPIMGDWSVTFGLNGISRISISQGVTPVGSILYRKYISDRKAFRAGVQFNV
ncbi:MAG: hypothetical protein M3Q97_06865, partial [Bacteroidota bacterium]|nr:hypothetical protein [Bacteroidota bacterium]